MQKIISTLLLAMAAAMPGLYAQQVCLNPSDPNAPCCNGLIHTWPPQAVNTERPSLVNHFDWTQPNINSYHPLGGYFFGTGPQSLPNPFYTQEPVLQHINFHNFGTLVSDPAKLDFHPEDGWELLHRHFGYEPDEQTLVTNALDNRIGPYFILYNKYTGLMRLLGSFNFDPNQKIVTDISFNSSGANLVPSGLLMNHNTILRALDKPTDEHSIAKVAPFATGKGFFVADFSMAYDPCICNHESELQIQFSLLNHASVQMDGRLIATSVPLNGSGTSPLLNSPDFLMAVKRDPSFNTQGGALTYHNIDALVKKYQFPPDTNMTDLDKEALKLFGDGLKEGAKSGDKWLNGLISPIIKDALVSTELISPTEKFSLGISLFAQGANMVMGQITPQKPGYIPNIQFIEGELSLSGTVTDSTPLGNGSIILRTPGSQNSNNPALHWKNYPAYNEALGLFAMLETPRMYVEQGSDPVAYEQGGKIHNNMVVNYTRFKLGDLKYTFNPAAEIDLDQTRMYVSLETELARPRPNLHSDFYAGAYQPQTGNFVMTTDFFPVNCFYNVAPAFYDTTFAILNTFGFGITPNDAGNIVISQNPDLPPDYSFHFENPTIHGSDKYKPIRWSSTSPMRLKILIEYVFKPNRYGKVNRSFQELTYPVELADGHPSLPGGADEYIVTGSTVQIDPSGIREAFIYPVHYGYPVQATYNLPRPSDLAPIYLTEGSGYYGVSTLHSAWNKILVKGNIGTYNGAEAKLTASNEIELTTGTEISNNVSLELKFPTGTGVWCDMEHGPRPAPVSNQEVYGFCNGNKYQARVYNFKRAPDTVATAPQKLPPSFQSRIYPNPAGNAFKVLLQAEQNTKAGISIYNMQGRLLFRSDTMPIAKGNSEWPFELELANGVYFVNVQEQSNTLTHKLIIAH